MLAKRSCPSDQRTNKRRGKCRDTAVALSLGTVLAALPPKNVLSIVAGVAVFAFARLSGQQESVAYLIFAAVATIGIAIPVFLYMALGRRGPEVTRAPGDSQACRFGERKWRGYTPGGLLRSRRRIWLSPHGGEQAAPRKAKISAKGVDPGTARSS
jgi:hypothetical protein